MRAHRRRMKSPRELPAIGAATVGTGAALTAAIAGACCVGPAIAPLLLSVLGASGLVAIANIQPYTWWLLLGAAALLAFSFRQVYRARACATGDAPQHASLSLRVSRLIVWVASVLWIISASYAAYGALHE